MTRVFTITVLLALVAGCDLTGISEQRLVGVIGYPDNLSIQVPDTVAAGQDFAVTVRTFGVDSCWRDGGTEVAVSGLTATVTPYDVDRAGRGALCTYEPVEITHSATLGFDQAGTARVEIIGSDGTAERSVVVESITDG